MSDLGVLVVFWIISVVKVKSGMVVNSLGVVVVFVASLVTTFTIVIMMPWMPAASRTPMVSKAIPCKAGLKGNHQNGR